MPTRGTLAGMSTHPFDQALTLSPLGSGRYAGHTAPAYWNMIGPYGGITAALVLQAVMQHPDRLGEPITLTVNFAGVVPAGAFEAHAVALRTNRSTQHWTVTLASTSAQGQTQISTSATVVTALRRGTFVASDAPMPTPLPAPASLAEAVRPAPGVAWLDSYELRPITGHVPERWDGQGVDSQSLLWLRDCPPRPLDFCSLTALADLFFPRIWLRRATRVPVGTVAMTVYFHADGPGLAATGDGYLLGQVRGQGFRNGFFDHSGQLWNEAGTLLATTHQIVYFKA